MWQLSHNGQWRVWGSDQTFEALDTVWKAGVPTSERIGKRLTSHSILNLLRVMYHGELFFEGVILIEEPTRLKIR
jgi:hypothetical protein